MPSRPAPVPDECQLATNAARSLASELIAMTSHVVRPGITEGDARFTAVADMGKRLADAIDALAAECRRAGR